MKDSEEFSMPGDLRDFVEKPIYFDLLEDLMLFLFLYPVVVYILRFFERPLAAYLMPLLLFAGMLLSTVNRKKAKRMLLFLPVSLLISAVFAAAGPGLAGKLVFGPFMFIVFVASVARFNNELKRQEVDYDHPGTKARHLYFSGGFLALGTGVCYAAVLASLAVKRGDTATLSILCFALLLICYESYRHLSGTLAVVSRGYSKAALARIRGLNRAFILVLSLVLSAVTAVCYGLYQFTAIKSIDLSIVHRRSPETLPPSPPMQTQPEASGGGGMHLPAIGKGNPVIDAIFHFFYTAVTYICLALLVLLVIFAVASFLRFLLRSNRSSSAETRQSVFSAADLVKEARRRARDRITPYRFLGKPNNVRIRKLYYRFIQKRMKPDIPIAQSDSPAEISGKISLSLRGEATLLYEKARYGKGECSEAEVALIREELRGGPTDAQ